MRRPFWILAAVAAVIIGMAASERAYGYSITYDDLSSSDIVTTQYSASGVTFSGAVVLTAGVSLNEIDFPPFSGSNVIAQYSTDPITLTFSTPVLEVGGYFTYASPITLTAYDSASAVIATATSLSSSNLGSPNEFVQVAAAGGISIVTISPSFSFTLDDLTVTPSSVPEPSSLLLLGIGVVALVARRVVKLASQ